MSAKHTPGPWKEVGGRAVFGPDHIVICRCGNYSKSIMEDEANARLIAAAPDLLDALRNLLTNDSIAELIDAIRLKHPDTVDDQDARLINSADEALSAISNAEEQL